MNKKQELEYYKNILKKHHISTRDAYGLDKDLDFMEEHIKELEELVKFLADYSNYKIETWKEKETGCVYNDLVITTKSGGEDRITLGEHGEELLINY